MKLVVMWIGLNKMTVGPYRLTREFDNHYCGVRLIRSGIVVLGSFIGTEKVKRQYLVM